MARRGSLRTPEPAFRRRSAQSRRRKSGFRFLLPLSPPLPASSGAELGCQGTIPLLSPPQPRLGSSQRKETSSSSHVQRSVMGTGLACGGGVTTGPAPEGRAELGRRLSVNDRQMLLGVVAPSFNPSAGFNPSRGSRSSEFEANLVYITSSRTSRTHRE